MKDCIYKMSPIWMQNTLVALAGLQLQGQRRGGNFKGYLNEALASEVLPPEALEKIQFQLLSQTLSHAFDTVPFYQEWCCKNKATIKDFNSIRDLSSLPIIDKDDIRSNPKKFCSSDMLKKRDLLSLHTSGTTGKPLVVLCDKDSRRKHFAFWERFIRWHGVRNGSWRATLCGRIAVPQEQKKPPFWRYDLFQRNVLFSSYHLSDKNMSFYVNKLHKIRPEYLDGYPSSISLLANYMLENDVAPIPSLKAIFTSAETLLPYQREAIEKAFDAPVADQYGCTEMAVFIAQCEYGSYHFNNDYSLLEVLGKDYKPSPPGEWGEAVCTSFINKTMPLIRYRLGDLLRAPEPSSCRCGRPFPTIKEIIGRKDDMIQTPDGRQVGRLDPVFKGLENIKETQIIQTDMKNILVKLVPGILFSDTDKKRLIESLKARIGDEMDIEIEQVEVIPREKNGKFRSVVSYISETLGK